MSISNAREEHESFPFLRLPAEIRNEIYACILSTSSTSYPFCESADRDVIYAESTEAIVSVCSELPQLALSRTCRQIHHEMKALPVQYDTIHFIGLKVFERNALRLSPDLRGSIYSINLEVGTYEWFAVPSALKLRGYKSMTDLLPNVADVCIIELEKDHYPARPEVLKHQAQKSWFIQWVKEGNKMVKVTEGGSMTR